MKHSTWVVTLSLIISVAGLVVLPPLIASPCSSRNWNTVRNESVEKLERFVAECGERAYGPFAKEELARRTKFAEEERAKRLTRDQSIRKVLEDKVDAEWEARANEQIKNVQRRKFIEMPLGSPSAKVIFKLVETRGGDAVANVTWHIYSHDEVFLKTIEGALPSQVLSPGHFKLIAEYKNRKISAEFSVAAGDRKTIELVMP